MDGAAIILEAPESAKSAPASMPSAPMPAQGVDYARRVDELGGIIAQYINITDRLQKSHEQLTNTVIRLRSELSEKNRLLERRNRLAALGEMAAGMAHELRNPLGAVQLYASLLATDVADRRESAELVRKISGGVKRLDLIVSQVLQFSRDLRVQMAEVSLREVIDAAVDDAAGALRERNVDCAVDGPDGLTVAIDRQLFGQALLNLVLNAAEAIEQAGRIDIKYGPPAPASEARQFCLSVRDTGPGIPPASIDRIFNPFFTTKDSGTGLGLAIVHRIIEAHDGAIMAMNPPDGGAKFDIRI